MPTLRGIIRTAELAEYPPGSDRVEMVLAVQGVGPAQPRRIVLLMELLIANDDLEPEAIQGHGFDADVEPDPADPKRWIVSRISVASRALRPPVE